jgi:hypothetical protein
MATSNPVELAAEIVSAFVSYNPVPKGDLPALIHAVHSAVERLEKRAGDCAASHRGESARSADPQVDHPGLFDLSRGRQTIQVDTTSPGGARPDAGAVSREMGPAVGLSHGRAQLRGAAIGVGEDNGTRPYSAQSRCPQEEWPAKDA